MTYTATLTNAAQGDVTVTLDNGETITIADGATTGTVDVTVAADEDVYTDASSISASITGATGGNFENLAVDSTAATTAITDTIDTTTVSLSATDVNDDAESVTFTATLSNTGETDVTITTDQGSILIVAGQLTGTLVVDLEESDISAGSISSSVSDVSGGNYEDIDFSSASATAEIFDITPTAAPGVVITEDTNNDGYISSEELNGAVNVTISLTDTGAVEGDTLTVNGVDMVLTASDILADEVLTTVAVPAEGTNLVVNAVITDIAGNTSDPGSDSAVLDTSATAGTVAVDAITSDDVINATEASGTVSVTGTASGGDIAVGDTVTLEINGTTYTTTVAADNTWSVDVAGSDLENDTAFDAVVESSDAAGNTVDTTGSSTHTVDTSASGQIDIDWITSDSIINADESAAGVLVAITGHVGNDAQPGDTVTITLEGNVIGSAQVSNSQDGSGNYLYSVDVLGSTLANTSLSNPVVIATVTGTDDAGNSFSASSSEVYQVDIFADVDVFVEDNNNSDSDNVVNFDEQGNMLIGGFFEVGGSVNSITITDSQGNELVIASNQVYIDQDYFEVTVDVSSLVDGTLSVVVNASDAAGNTEDSATETIVKDTSADVDSNFSVTVDAGDEVLNDSESSDVSVTLDGVDSVASSFVVTFNYSNDTSVTTTATHSGTLWMVADTDLSRLADGAISVSAVVTDDAGNTSTATDSIDFDTSADTDANFSVSVATSDETTNAAESGDVSVTLTGIDTDATSVLVTFTDSTGANVTTTATDINGVWSVSDTDISSLTDGAISVTAVVTDDAGNTSTATDSLDLDTSADTDNNLGVTVALSDEETDEFEVADVSVSLTGVDSDAVSVLVSFTDENNAVVTVTATQVAGVWTVPDTDISSLDDGTIDISVVVTDDAGNTSTAVDSLELDTLNSAPVITGATDTRLSEEGLLDANPDTDGNTDTTNVISFTSSFSVSDVEGESLTVTLNVPTESLTSDGVAIVWSGDGTSTLIGSAAGVEVIRVVASDPDVNGDASYTTTLSGPVDHSNTSEEDELSFNLDVVVSDGTNDTTETVSIAIEDDSPDASNTSATLTVATNTITVKNLEAGFSDTTYAPDEDEVTETDNDSDALIDTIAWGTGESGASSLSLTDDTDLTSTTGSNVEDGASFDLLDFEHVNTAVYSNTSSLESADIDVTFDLEVNGTATAVTIALAISHDATSNSGGSTDDTVTIVTQSVDVVVDGQTYTVVIEGFTDDSGNTVSTISTAEGATDSYALTAHINAPAQTISGTVNTDAGADGLDEVVWGDVNSSYGTLTANSDGSYVFTLDSSVTITQTVVETFSYQVVDNDGDVITNILSISLEPEDTSADEDNNFAVTVATSDETANADESDDVSVVLSGVDSDASSVLVTFTDGANATVTTTATQVAGVWSVADADLSGLADGSISVSAVVTDFSGNTSTATDSLDLDTSADTTDANLSVTAEVFGGIANAAQSTGVGVSLEGIDSDASSVVVTFTDSSNASITATATQSSGFWLVDETDISGLTDGAINISAVVTDDAGNTSTATDSLNLDTVAAGAPSVTITEDADNDGLISAAELSGDINVTVALTGTNAVAGDTLTVNGSDILLTTSHITAGEVLTTVAAPAAGTSLTVSVTITDIAGNMSQVGTDSATRVNLVADTATTAEDTGLSVDAAQGVLSNDVVGSSTVSSFSVSGQVVSAGSTLTIANIGDLVINTDGSYDFTPVEDWSGSVPQVTYTTSSGDTSTLDITVTAVADVPTLTITLGDPGSQSTTETGSNVSDLGLNTSSEDTETRILDFGLENAGQTVTLSFDSVISGGWEDSGTYADSYEVSANGTLLESFVYSQNDNDSQSQSNSYSVVLDSNGQVQVEFSVDSTGSNEEVDISNIQATLGSNSSVRDLTITAAQTDNDGSETLTYTVAALPTGVSLLASDGSTITANQDGSYSLTEAQVTGLQLDTGDVTDSFDISVSVTSSEGVTSESVTQTVTVESSTTTFPNPQIENRFEVKSF